MECFAVNADEIDGRIDPNYYKFKFREFGKKLKNCPFNLVSFGEIINSLINGFDFRKFTKEGTTYLKVANIKPFEIKLENVNKVPLNFDEISKKIHLKKDDLCCRKNRKRCFV